MGAGTGVEIDEAIESKEREGEDAERKRAGGGGGDAGEAKGDPFDSGPDRQGDGGIEVALEIPVAEKVMADGGVAVPAFVGVLGPIDPGRVVGEVGGEMEEVQGEEDGRDDEQDRSQRAGEVMAGGGRDGVVDWHGLELHLSCSLSYSYDKASMGSFLAALRAG